MSTITDTAPQTHDLQVRTDPAGKPPAIRHDGTIWLVDPNTDSHVQVRLIYPPLGFPAT
ncbi:hypothetical protein [Arthrobacter sp. UYCu712]|uniref:hypothetical protein n=1 Tax=Arthrobacter sp. UYCu712 TaxID=3156340 RepID=UPI00339361DC